MFFSSLVKTQVSFHAGGECKCTLSASKSKELNCTSESLTSLKAKNRQKREQRHAGKRTG